VAFCVVAGLCYIDWFGALIGLWLGLSLYSNVVFFAVLPIIALVSAAGGMKKAAVVSAVLVVFGFFLMDASLFGLTLPAQFAAPNLFPSNLSSISKIPFASLIMSYLFGPSWQQGLNSSLASTVISYSPIYFIIISAILIPLVHYLSTFMKRVILGPQLAIVIAALIGTAIAASLYGTLDLLAVSCGLVVLLWFLLNATSPLLGPKPRLSSSGIRQLFSRAPVVEAAAQQRDGAVLVATNPSKTFGGMSYWDRARGLDVVKEDLVKSVILPLNMKSEAETYGVKPVRGILLYGPPGTGKTMLLRGLASRLAMTYVEVNPGTLLSKWYGESEQRMRKVVDTALRDSPAILAIDELDSIGKDRSSYSNDDVAPRVLNVLLMGMDRISANKADVVVMATTNKPQVLDQALLRAGRFDKIIYVGPPDEQARQEIFRVYLRDKEKVLSEDIDYAKLAKLSERFTGADIEALVNNVMSAAFYDKVLSNRPEKITQETLEKAIRATKPTIDRSMLEEFEKFRLTFQREKRMVKGWESGIPNVKFDDIGDLEQVKAALKEAFEMPLSKTDLVEKLSIQPVKGILLYGPPGNGKTLLAKAVANEVSANFFTICGADLAKTGPSQAAATIKDLFNLARDNPPAIIFLDEIDQLAPDRSNPLGADFIPVTTQLLGELDGVKDLKGVMVLAATNRPQGVDPALLRANRLEKHLLVPVPDEQARVKIFETCLKGVNSKDISTEELAKMSEGFSGADINELVNSAKKVVVSASMNGSNRDWIIMDDFRVALEKKKQESLDSNASNKPPVTNSY
jgi:SpoVK/Ycf46/Vps4 family AAA+-type ATPase